MRLILASASPRRADLLASAGFSFDVHAAAVDETPMEGERAELYTQRVARDKAQHVFSSIAGADTAVLGADTEVVIDGLILGKPVDEGDAARMLRRLSGQVHDVLTAVVICANGREWSDVATTRVHFAELTDDEILAYVGSGEPMGKAGAYAIQGRGARYIERIEGSWSNVVGLPLHVVHRLLREVQ